MTVSWRNYDVVGVQSCDGRQAWFAAKLKEDSFLGCFLHELHPVLAHYDSIPRKPVVGQAAESVHHP